MNTNTDEYIKKESHFSVAADGSSLSSASRAINSSSQYGLMAAIRVIEALATPGVLVNMSTRTPMPKAHNRMLHFDMSRGRMIMK
jgi:uncharacterized membrane protein (UPF0136 family)